MDTLRLQNPCPPLALALFGPFTLRVRGQAVDIPRSKVKWLLALLVLAPELTENRSWLAAQLWPDTDPNRARDHLRNHLKWLRQALGEEKARLASTRERIALDLTGARVDVADFDAAIHAATPRRPGGSRPPLCWAAPGVLPRGVGRSTACGSGAFLPQRTGSARGPLPRTGQAGSRRDLPQPRRLRRAAQRGGAARAGGRADHAGEYHRRVQGAHRLSPPLPPGI